MAIIMSYVGADKSRLKKKSTIEFEQKKFVSMTKSDKLPVWVRYLQILNQMWVRNVIMK